ncbi:MAG: sulfatase-like hydrolase/transferase [Verrucomicrobiia bacterium]
MKTICNAAGTGRMLALLMLALAWAPVAQAKERPNFLVLLSDDHNYRTLGAAGNAVLRTPHLDRLAKEGVYFNRCFTPNPICQPSRASFYTGQSSWANGVTFNGKPMKKGSPLLARTLAEAGYETYFTGKWHGAGKPWTMGFTTGGRCWAGGEFDHFELALTPFGGGPDSRKTAQDYSSTVFTDDALAYLEGKRDKPFCAVVAYTVGHDVFKAPPGYEGKYAPAEIPLPPNFMAQPPFKQFNPAIRDETVLPFPRDEQSVRVALAEYYAMFEHLDAQIGRLLGALERTGMSENTVVIFASVKGMSMGSHGIIGKQTLYEEGIRSSLIVRHPGLRRAAGVSSELVSTMDILPTVCTAAGVELPAGVEGVSFLPFYEGRGEGRKRLFFMYDDPRRFTVTRAVRTRRYKFVQHLVTHESQLFDLVKDPNEMVNLAGAPEMKDVKTKLRASLMEWRKRGEEK